MFFSSQDKTKQNIQKQGKPDQKNVICKKFNTGLRTPINHKMSL